MRDIRTLKIKTHMVQNEIILFFSNVNKNVKQEKRRLLCVNRRVSLNYIVVMNVHKTLAVEDPQNSYQIGF